MQDLGLYFSLYLNYNINKVPSKQVARMAKTLLSSQPLDVGLMF